MWDQEKVTDVTEKGLRTFALTLFGALLVLSGLLFWKQGRLGWIPLGLGVVLLSAGVFSPKSLRPVYKIWMMLSMALGFITSHLVLMILYYFLFTPIGLVMRFVRKDPLERAWDPEALTYWKKRETKVFSKNQYEKMY